MPPAGLISESYATTAGIVLLTVVGIAYGGTFVLKTVRGGQPATPLQRSFFRAGHAHAGMFVTLGLLVTLIVELAGVSGPAASLADGVLLAAILMPAGFFLSVAHKGAEKPNRFIVLLWLGVGSLVVGVVAAGVGLLSL